MSFRKYKALYSKIPDVYRIQNVYKPPKPELSKVILKQIMFFIGLVLFVIVFFPGRITLVYLSTVATLRHTFVPNKFTGNYASNPYKLLKYYYDAKLFNQLSTEDKCTLYFKKVFPKTKWRFDTFDSEIYWLDVLREKYDLLRDREKKGCESLGKTFSETWFRYEYLEKMQNNLDFEDAIVNSIPHYKYFNKCYLDDIDTSKEHNLSDKALQLSQSVEDKLFPWVSKKLIDYKRSKTNDIFQDNFKKRTFHSYVKNMKQSFTGKGIAISASNNHFKLLSGLIALLRVQGNTLPIEIIYRDDLSVWNQEDLMEIATTDNLLDDNGHLTALYEHVLKENKGKSVDSLLFDNFSVDGKTYNFPKQDIRFVNAKIAIKDEYQNLFQAYSNKLVAFYFSSFKEVLLMDSDTVPLINPGKFFENEKYLRNKAFFFRDREINEHFPDESIAFFKKLLPNQKDTDFFGLAQISQESLFHNRFLNNSLNHLMESGIVVIDKHKHYNGVLLTMALQSWKPISQPIHGEKELYWLGQLIASDEKFDFNNNYAISLGKLTEKKFDNTEVQTKANELCSTHPGHISDDNSTLYWMNSGFEFCKKQNRFEIDLPIELNYYGHFDQQHLAKYKNMPDYYKEPLRINAALIPPSTQYQYNNTKPYFEPSRSWVMTQKCEGYLWCAYDLIGGGDYVGDQYKGKVVQFESNIERIYDFYGDLWMYYYNLII